MPHPPASRRAFLQVGASSAVGLGLADLFAHRVVAAGAADPKSVILVNLTGGMSHLDSST